MNTNTFALQVHFCAIYTHEFFHSCTYCLTALAHKLLPVESHHEYADSAPPSS